MRYPGTEPEPPPVTDADEHRNGGKFFDFEKQLTSFFCERKNVGRNVELTYSKHFGCVILKHLNTETFITLAQPSTLDKKKIQQGLNLQKSPFL